MKLEHEGLITSLEHSIDRLDAFSAAKFTVGDLKKCIGATV